MVVQLKNARGWGMEDKVKQEDFEVEIKILSGIDVAKLYPVAVASKDNIFLQKEVYVFGKVLNSSDRTAIVLMDIKCKQVPYLEKKDMTIGWIGPNKTSPIFFLECLGEYLENDDIHKFEMTYKIKKVWKK